MKLLKALTLLTEKKIGTIISNIESIAYSFEVITTKHSNLRTTRPDLEDLGYSDVPVSNGEIRELIRMFRTDIAESIVFHDIQNESEFIIRSIKNNLSCAIVAQHNGGLSWSLIVKTVFREDEDFNLLYGKDQMVFKK
jgi:hypothetical protein